MCMYGYNESQRCYVCDMSVVYYGVECTLVYICGVLLSVCVHVFLVHSWEWLRVCVYVRVCVCMCVCVYVHMRVYVIVVI